MANSDHRQPRSRIAARRQESGLSQRELSELTGISMRQVQRLDGGEIDNPPIRYLVNIAMVLEVDVLDICEDEWLEWRAFGAGPATPPATRN